MEISKFFKTNIKLLYFLLFLNFPFNFQKPHNDRFGKRIYIKNAQQKLKLSKISKIKIKSANILVFK